MPDAQQSPAGPPEPRFAVSPTNEYRKRPIAIEAVQFAYAESAEDPHWRVFEEDAPAWLREAIETDVVKFEFRSEDYWYFTVRTLEGLMTGGPDDWLIRGIEGELYPCARRIFEATYEAV